MGRLPARPALKLGGDKHVVIRRTFAEDESSILSTSNWLDDSYNPTSLRTALELRLRGLHLSVASSGILNSKVVVFHPLPNSGRFPWRAQQG